MCLDSYHVLGLLQNHPNKICRHTLETHRFCERDDTLLCSERHEYSANNRVSSLHHIPSHSNNQHSHRPAAQPRRGKRIEQVVVCCLASLSHPDLSQRTCVRDYIWHRNTLRSFTNVGVVLRLKKSSQFISFALALARSPYLKKRQFLKDISARLIDIYKAYFDIEIIHHS